MTGPVQVHALASPWGRFSLYSFFIDAEEPAIIDTGIASSPQNGLAPALEALGRRIEDVRWILLTHGHIDHVGGAFALWEMTGRRAQVVIHPADAPMIRSRRAHVDEYLDGRGRYLHDPQGEQQQIAAANAVVSGELEPTLLVRGGETIPLGGGVTVSVQAIPGHTPGSVAYVIDGQNDVFVGDAVQIHGAANGFPGFMNPAEYRLSLIRLRDEVQPSRMFLGHPYRGADGEPYGIELDSLRARAALEESLMIEHRAAEAAHQCLTEGLVESDSPYSPFEAVADRLDYRADPTLEPSPFFTSMHGYRVHTSPSDPFKEPHDHG